MIQEIIFYGMGIILVALFIRMLKSQLFDKSGCGSCSNGCKKRIDMKKK